jgi:FkbM family methyltransferase
VTLLTIPSVSAQPFVMVEAGARETPLDSSLLRAFPRLEVVGFEPDPDECRRLTERHRAPHRFFPVALGSRCERRILYRTPVPHYSSLFPPDAATLDPCWERDLGFFPAAEMETTLADLDTFLPSQGIAAAHFMQIDTQGGELEVLEGAHHFLRSSVLGVRVEVFLNPLYTGQPLFDDIERYLQTRGFQLFALTDIPYRLHRRTLPPGRAGKGQPVALDALYLRDFRELTRENRSNSLATLAMLASALGFHDYAAQIVQALLADCRLEPTAREELSAAQRPYVAALLLAGDRSG